MTCEWVLNSQHNVCLQKKVPLQYVVPCDAMCSYSNLSILLHIYRKKLNSWIFDVYRARTLKWYRIKRQKKFKMCNIIAWHVKKCERFLNKNTCEYHKMLSIVSIQTKRFRSRDFRVYVCARVKVNYKWIKSI